MEDNSTFPLLAGLALIISSVERITEHIADTTEHVAAIVQIVVALVAAVVHQVHEIHLLDPSSPLLRLMMAVGVGLVGLELVRTGWIQVTIWLHCRIGGAST